ncbi:testis anion transporter 1 isoform X2 [Elephas maximus indicus]|uniref:testis anion transporter 1 isoform X2 n=1 Tax=Elephas maximus indicus TaxID=99487 RepID=UPI002116A784|nr:testis anion transporter 1 isoform X2 [Elephas maximus indicus]
MAQVRSSLGLRTRGPAIPVPAPLPLLPMPPARSERPQARAQRLGNRRRLRPHSRPSAASRARAASDPTVVIPAFAREPEIMQPERSTQTFNSKYRQNSFTYDVKREVYNEENFQQEHRKKAASSGNLDINITTFRHHVQCRCSWHKFIRCMLTIFPFLEWVCLYRFKDWLLGDLIAGISVGLVQVPQGLMFSLLARQLIPPLNISYAAFCSSVIYVIFGSCHQMSIGSFFLVSALMINVLKLNPFNSGHLVLGTFLKDDFSQPSFLTAYNRSLSVVASTTFLAGIIQLSMGVLGFGFIATYLPESVINAYLAATALHIMLSQLTCILGIVISFHAGPVAFFYNIINYCLSLPKANSTSILLFLTAVVALRINKCIKISFNRYPIEFPMEFLLIVGFTLIANKLSMATETSKTLVEMIPYSFLFPVIPDMDILSKVIFQAISLALVSSSLLVFLGKKIAAVHNYRVNSNQAVLAGVILSNVTPYLGTISNLPHLWRQDQYDCVIWLVTFSSAIFLGLDFGLLVSVAFAFFIIAVRSHRAKIYLLGQIPNTNIYRSISDYREITNIPGVKIFQCCNSITFVNVYQLKRRLLNEIDMIRVRLKEEEVFGLFTRCAHSGHTSREAERGCRCYCNCDEPEPPPRIAYTERFERKLGHSSSTIHLVSCARFESVTTNQSTSDEQVPYTVSSTSQRNQGRNLEEEEKVWVPNNPLRNSSPPLPDTTESQGRSRSLLPYSDVSLLPTTHTIILDFSMVHFVDSQASVILRQMCNAFQNANMLVLIAGCHSSVIRALERNDFFDTGITKAQLFLTLHDAVLFALSRKIPDSSELSVDESETVIQETFSEKNEEPGYHMNNSNIEIPKNTNPGFRALIREPEVVEESELEPTLESEQENELDLDLDLDLELEPESELEPEPEIDLEPELETESETEPVPKSRPRVQTHSPQYRRSPYPSSQPQTQPWTRSVERRHQHMDLHSSKGNDTKDPWEEDWI